MPSVRVRTDFRAGLGAIVVAVIALTSSTTCCSCTRSASILRFHCARRSAGSTGPAFTLPPRSASPPGATQPFLYPPLSLPIVAAPPRWGPEGRLQLTCIAVCSSAARFALAGWRSCSPYGYLFLRGHRSPRGSSEGTTRSRRSPASSRCSGVGRARRISSGQWSGTSPRRTNPLLGSGCCPPPSALVSQPSRGRFPFGIGSQRRGHRWFAVIGLVAVTLPVTGTRPGSIGCPARTRDGPDVELSGDRLEQIHAFRSWACRNARDNGRDFRTPEPTGCGGLDRPAVGLGSAVTSPVWAKHSCSRPCWSSAASSRWSWRCSMPRLTYEGSWAGIIVVTATRGDHALIGDWPSRPQARYDPGDVTPSALATIRVSRPELIEPSMQP